MDGSAGRTVKAQLEGARFGAEALQVVVSNPFVYERGVRHDYHFENQSLSIQ
ncbi:MAG: hypothetical protein H6Q82_2064 [Deltaproteobacteria bacterium]|nr:hypothetical protein [Deltaproteobacteria bacterium]